MRIGESVSTFIGSKFRVTLRLEGSNASELSGEVIGMGDLACGKPTVTGDRRHKLNPTVTALWSSRLYLVFPFDTLEPCVSTARPERCSQEISHTDIYG